MYVSKVCRCGDEICSPDCSGGHICGGTTNMRIYAVDSEWLSFFMLSKNMSIAFYTLLHCRDLYNIVTELNRKQSGNVLNSCLRASQSLSEY